MIKRLLGIAIVATMVVSCGAKSGSRRTTVYNAGLATESDSLSYIIGMSVVEQLVKMDSMLSLDVVCRAIMEHSRGEAVFNRDDARQDYLRYLLYVEPERRRGYEEKFLSDLAESDRSYTRTKSGLTYHVDVIGNESLTPRMTSDWLSLKYTIARVGGEQIYPQSGEESEVEEAALTDLPKGIEEAVRMIGEGGKIRAWIPSKLLFGEAGNAELGIEPIETIYYDIELVKVERGKASERKKEQVEF